MYIIRPIGDLKKAGVYGMYFSNGSFYIGSCCHSFSRRFAKHTYLLKNGGGSNLLRRAYLESSIIEFKILEIISDNKLCALIEVEYMNRLNPDLNVNFYSRIIT